MLHQHFKGGLYLKLLEAKDCEDPTRILVVYLSLTGGGVWVREKSNFESQVETDGFNECQIHYISRFKPLSFRESLTAIRRLLRRKNRGH